MTANEFVAVNFRLWRRQPATRRSHWLLGTAVLLLSVGVGLDIAQNGRISNSSTVVFLVVGVLYGLFRLGLVRYQLRRGYVKNTGLHHPIDFTFTAETLRGNSADGHFEARWRPLRRAAWVKPHWLLLYPTATACYYVDLRCLQAPGTPEQLLALVKDAGISVREV